MFLIENKTIPFHSPQAYSLSLYQEHYKSHDSASIEWNLFVTQTPTGTFNPLSCVGSALSQGVRTATSQAYAHAIVSSKMSNKHPYSIASFTSKKHFL